MMHELFIALAGYETTLLYTFARNEKDKTGAEIFTEHDNIGGNAFHPCEIKIISEILQVAPYYRKIITFYRTIESGCISVSDTVDKSDVGVRNGHYLTTFASSLIEETKSYQKVVVKMEQEYLENPRLPLSKILLDVQPFHNLFVHLCYLIDVVEKDKLYGCKILDFLQKEVVSAVGEIHKVLNRIKCRLQKVLLEQLADWLLYGELLDPHKELFLKVNKETTSSSSLTEEISETIKSPFEVSLDVDLIPEFIPLSLAEKILFIGETILNFEREGVKDNNFSSKRGLILRSREKEILERFDDLSHHETLSANEFSDFIESIRRSVAQYVYAVVVDAGLTLEFQHVKDFFLLGRGELYQAFYLLTENRRLNTSNVNALFQRAGRQILMEEQVMNKFTVTYANREASSSEKGSSFKNLKIAYKAEWPLRRIFDYKVQSKYNAIFQFLLDIRHSQLRLQYLWISQKGNKAFRIDNSDVLCWTLRHHMSFLIFNIQYYIQVDVLESHFNGLMEEIKSTKDYQQICYQHQSFLSTITAQCFLHHPLISTSIYSILDRVNAFCSLLQGSPTRSEIEKIRDEFDRDSARFFWALKTLSQLSRKCRHTEQLVMRIDYNKFYSRNPFNIKYMESMG